MQIKDVIITKKKKFPQKQIQKIVQQDTVPNELNNKGKNFICEDDGWMANGNGVAGSL